MFVSDQLNSDSQILDTRNIVERVNRIAPFFEYDEDPYIIVRDDGTLAWIIDAYLVEQGYPYAENYQGNNNYIKNAAKVMIDAYTGEVNFFVTEPDDPLLQTYQNIFPALLLEWKFWKMYKCISDIQKIYFRFKQTNMVRII